MEMKGRSMERKSVLMVLAVALVLSSILSACSGTAAPPAAPASAQGLDTTYTGALNVRSQLLLGIVRLEESSGSQLSKEQAASLLTLWQVSRSMTAAGTSSQAEQDAISSQILAVLTQEQVQAIRNMRLAQADMQAFNQSLGVSGTGRESGAGGGMPGQGQNLSPEARATRQAESGGNTNSGSLAALDHLIALLKTKSGR